MGLRMVHRRLLDPKERFPIATVPTVDACTCDWLKLNQLRVSEHSKAHLSRPKNNATQISLNLHVNTARIYGKATVAEPWLAAQFEAVMWCMFWFFNSNSMYSPHEMEISAQFVMHMWCRWQEIFTPTKFNFINHYMYPIWKWSCWLLFETFIWFVNGAKYIPLFLCTIHIKEQGHQIAPPSSPTHSKLLWFTSYSTGQTLLGNSLFVAHGLPYFT